VRADEPRTPCNQYPQFIPPMPIQPTESVRLYDGTNVRMEVPRACTFRVFRSSRTFVPSYLRTPFARLLPCPSAPLLLGPPVEGHWQPGHTISHLSAALQEDDTDSSRSPDAQFRGPTQPKHFTAEGAKTAKANQSSPNPRHTTARYLRDSPSDFRSPELLTLARLMKQDPFGCPLTIPSPQRGRGLR
jgi:hypothetical protein